MSTTIAVPAVFVTANRAAVYGTVARWLLHDLRNPTQALSLLTELMGDAPVDLDPDLHATLRHSTHHLTQCVELLDRTLRTTPHPATPEPVSLATVMTFLTQLYLSHKSPIQIDISQLLAEPLPAVTGVEDHLEHALLNLLINAMEAFGNRPHGQITVTGTTSGNRVKLVIDDNGPGVAPEMCNRLFEPYATTKTAAAGTSGLGLAVTRHLMEMYGGSIVYAPKATAGAQFILHLVPWQ